MKNLAEFKALILRYRGITLEEIQSVETESKETEVPIIAILIGAGRTATCTLCKPLFLDTDQINCAKCVWSVKGVTRTCSCCAGSNEDTYDALFTDNPQALLTAVRARADHMEAHLTKLGITL